MSEEPRKRSRFDQAPDDAEPARKSRFDRRSRSPANKDKDARSRSPLKSTETVSAEDAKKDAAARAAEAAAKINASLASKKGIQHVDVPPIRSSPSVAPGASKSPSASDPSGTLNNDIYQQDGDFIKDIEVNDLRNRYTLTKGSTQKMIKEETGADVTTRGNYYPDKSMATAANPPLYLHVTSTTKDGLEKAVVKIEELMKQELPNLIDERRFRRRDTQEDRQERDHLGRRKWPEERIPIDLEPIPGFNLRAQVVGHQGSYVKHIQQETRCRVQIKGRGSGFMEHETGHESDEQMYLHVAGPEQVMVDQAKEMCISLLDSVREAYEQFKERGPPQRGGPRGDGGGFGDQNRYNGRGGDRQHSGSYGGNGSGVSYGGNGHSYGGDSSYGGSSGYGAAAAAVATAGYSTPGYAAQGYGVAHSPPNAQSAAAAAAPADPLEQQRQFEAWAQYYAANPSADPYISYGGYAAVMAQYMQSGAGNYASQQGYQNPGLGQEQSPVSNGIVPPPPPPDDSASAPPPPPPPGAGNGYHGVPPPPGL